MPSANRSGPAEPRKANDCEAERVVISRRIGDVKAGRNHNCRERDQRGNKGSGVRLGVMRRVRATRHVALGTGLPDDDIRGEQRAEDGDDRHRVRRRRFDMRQQDRACNVERGMHGVAGGNHVCDEEKREQAQSLHALARVAHNEHVPDDEGQWHQEECPPLAGDNGQRIADRDQISDDHGEVDGEDSQGECERCVASVLLRAPAQPTLCGSRGQCVPRPKRHSTTPGSRAARPSPRCIRRWPRQRLR